MIFQNFEYLLKLNYDQFDKTLQKKNTRLRIFIGARLPNKL